MRRLTLILSLAVLMALAVSAAAFAAATITATGDTTFRTVFGEFTQPPAADKDMKYELRGEWRTRANLVYTANRGNVSSRVAYRLRSTSFVGLNQTGSTLASLSGDVLEGWIEAKGAWIPGTPEVTMRLGRFGTNQNAWIGHFGNNNPSNAERRDGILISGIALGPAKMNLYHGWVNSRNTILSLAGTAKIDIIDLNAAVVRHNDLNDAKSSKIDFAIGASTTPVAGVKISGDYASDGLNEASAWKLNGELKTIPNLTLRVGTWSTEDDFKPRYTQYVTKENLTMDRSWTSGINRAGIAWGDPWMKNGFSVGVTTTQAGLPITVDFRTGKIFESNVPGTVNNAYAGKGMNVVTAGTTVAQIKTDLTVTMIEDHDAVIDVVASRKVRLSAIAPGDIDVRGIVRLQDEETKFAADAIWSAPNGLLLGVHYANYDRKLDWNHNLSNSNLSEGFNIGEDGKADGFAITAGYQLTF